MRMDSAVQTQRRSGRLWLKRVFPLLVLLIASAGIVRWVTGGPGAAGASEPAGQISLNARAEGGRAPFFTAEGPAGLTQSNVKDPARLHEVRTLIHSLYPPPPEPDEALKRSIARTEGELQALARQNPEGFLKAILPPDSDPKYDFKASRHVESITKKYVERRRAVLEKMMRSYIAGLGVYDSARDLSELSDIDAEFRHSAALVRDRVPQVESICDVLGQTALPIPSFARKPIAVAALPAPTGRGEISPATASDTEIADETPLIGYAPGEELPPDEESSASTTQ